MNTFIDNVNIPAIRRIRLVLTNDDILNANGVDPIPLLPGKPGIAYMVISSIVYYDFSNGAYGNVDVAFEGVPVYESRPNPTDIGLDLFPYLQAADMATTIPTFSKRSSGGATFVGAVDPANRPLSDVVGQGILMRLSNNGAGPLTGGGDGNKIVIDMWLSEVEL